MFPIRWTRSTVGELCEMIKGDSQIARTKPGPYPLVTTGEERKTADRYQFDSAAVCVPMISAYGHGKPGLKRVQYQEGKFALANILTALLVRDTSRLTPRFLHLFLNYYKDQLIVPLQTGVANMALTIAKLATVPVAFPPLDEQHRIVAILDEAEALRQLRARADARMAEFIPALFNQMFGDPATNPKGWPSFTLDDVCDKITDGTHNSPPNIESGIPYITAKHLKPYGLDFSLDPTYISPEDHRLIYARCDPRRGDVLYIKDGVTTGLAAINYYDFEFSMLSSLALLRPNSNFCIPEYLWAWLNNPTVNYTMLQDMAGAAIKRLTIVKIKRAKVLIPSLMLQRDFAARVAEARAMQDQQARSRGRLEEGFQALLHRAFAGEL